jgi:hypothetical protein
MRIFLITLVVSIFETIVLWSFGLAQKIWPAHPLLAITAIAAISAIVIQALLSTDTRSRDSRRSR